MNKSFGKFQLNLILANSNVNKKKTHSRHITKKVYQLIVYKFRTIVGKTEFSDQLKNIKRDKHIGYTVDVMHAWWLPITVINFASVVNCMPVSRVSDSMIAPT